MLLAEGACELGARDRAALDQDLAETAVRLVLCEQRFRELGLRDQALLHEQPSERTPGRRDLAEVRLGLRLGLGLLQLDAVLRREDACERERGHVPAVDDDLAEQAAGAALLVERELELGVGQQAFVGQQRAELAPGKEGRAAELSTRSLSARRG